MLYCAHFLFFIYPAYKPAEERSAFVNWNVRRKCSAAISMFGGTIRHRITVLLS